MQNIKEHIEYLFTKSRNYVETSLALYKLQVIEFTADMLANLVSKFILILILSMFLLFFNIGVSFYFAAQLDSYFLGFTIVSGIYLCIGLIIFLFKNQLIINPLNNIIITELNREREITINTKATNNINNL